jgi:purine-binding chemotaxis protein CheW
LAASPVTDRTCIVIVEANINDTQTVMGIVADSVSQVISMSSDSILPAPAFGTRVRIDFLRGMGKSGDKFVLVLDIDKVLGADDLAPVAPSLNVLESTAEAGL